MLGKHEFSVIIRVMMTIVVIVQNEGGVGEILKYEL